MRAKLKYKSLHEAAVVLKIVKALVGWSEVPGAGCCDKVAEGWPGFVSWAICICFQLRGRITALHIIAGFSS